MADSRRVLLVGGGDLAEEVCEALDAAGAEVTWLEHTDDASLREGLAAKPDVVCVATRSDAFPLRIALLVRHLDADVPLPGDDLRPGDRTSRSPETVPNCRVTSIADIVAPSLAGPCISEGSCWPCCASGSGRSGSTRRSRRSSCRRRRRARLRSLTAAVLRALRPQRRAAVLRLRPGSSRCCASSWSARCRARPAVRRRRYGSAKSLATVGPNPAVDDGPKWFKVAIACLGDPHAAVGGVLHRRADQPARRLAPDRAHRQRAVPRQGHVIVVGLGQVGLRLCMLLRECGVLVVAVDADEDAETVGLARRLRIPVVIGRAANPELLRRLSLSGRRGRWPAVTTEDLVQHRVGAVARARGRRSARGVAGGRRGRGRRDALAGADRARRRRAPAAAAYLAGVALGSDADSVALRDGKAELLLPGGERETAPLVIAR